MGVILQLPERICFISTKNQRCLRKIQKSAVALIKAKAVNFLNLSRKTVPLKKDPVWIFLNKKFFNNFKGIAGKVFYSILLGAHELWARRTLCKVFFFLKSKDCRSIFEAYSAGMKEGLVIDRSKD